MPTIEEILGLGSLLYRQTTMNHLIETADDTGVLHRVIGSLPLDNGAPAITAKEILGMKVGFEIVDEAEGKVISAGHARQLYDDYLESLRSPEDVKAAKRRISMTVEEHNRYTTTIVLVSGLNLTLDNLKGTLKAATEEIPADSAVRAEFASKAFDSVKALHGAIEIVAQVAKDVEEDLFKQFESSDE